MVVLRKVNVRFYVSKSALTALKMLVKRFPGAAMCTTYLVYPPDGGTESNMSNEKLSDRVVILLHNRQLAQCNLANAKFSLNLT